jgi:hypothetical protein
MGILFHSKLLAGYNDPGDPVKAQLPPASRRQLESFEAVFYGLIARDLFSHLRLRRAIPVSFGVADGHGSDRRSRFLDVGD